MTESPMRSPRFWAYMGLLCLAALAILSVALRAETLAEDAAPLLALAALFALAELTVVLYNRSEGRVGLSTSEAILLTALVVVTAGEAVWVVALGTAAARIIDRIPAVKAIWNVAAATCAAGAAAGATAVISGLAPESHVTALAAAAVGVVVYAAATHVLVAGVISIAERSPFLPIVVKVPSATLLGVAVSILMGVLFGAAYLGSAWSLLIFPVVLIAVSLGYRAVLHQTDEKKTVESLHEASRALATNPDLRHGLSGFLASVARAVSGAGARLALFDPEAGFRTTAVRPDGTSEPLAPMKPGVVADFVTALISTPRAVLVSADDIPPEVAPVMQGLSARSLLAVPVFDGTAAIGSLMITDRIGADEFGERDIRLVEALANELALTLASQKLYSEVEVERGRFQLLVESLEDYAIFMLDPGGEVVSWNAGAERIYGYAADEVVGQHVSRFYPTERAEDAWLEELKVAATHGRHVSEGWRVRQDGSRFLADVAMAPVRNPSGALQGFAKVTRDITERVRARHEKEALESQLHQVQKLESVGQLAGGIAHDFNNILAVIANCADFVRDGLKGMNLEGDDAELLQDVDDIKAAASRGAALTRQLLVFSRRDAAQPEDLDLNKVITEVMKLVKRAAGENVTIETRLADELEAVTADRGQMEQVLLNLAINARDAMEGHGNLTITTTTVELEAEIARLLVDVRPGRYVQLSVVDTGKGMTPDVIEKAFDPFFTTKPKGQGTGLGLATVYGIVRRWGGHITIDSEPDKGSTFLIRLPVSEKAIVLALEEEADKVPAGKGENILLVEDEPAVRATARRILLQGGYRVVEAANADEALAIFDERPDIDAVVSDIAMPGMSGLEMGMILQEKRPGLPAVFMTGYSEAVAFPDALGGNSKLLQKPFDRTELLLKLEEVIGHPIGSGTN